MTIPAPAVPAVMVTVAIPVFDRRDFILECVASALAQDVAGLEVVVVDNRSTDGTWELLATLRDDRLRVERNERNLGLFGNLARCCARARGRYLRILCSDDRLPPGALAREVAAMEADPALTLLSARGICVDRAGHRVGTLGDYLPAGRYDGRAAIGAILRFWTRTWRNPLNFPSGVLARTDAIRAAGGFPTDLRIAGDLACWLELCRRGDLLISPHDGAVITVHDGQETVRLARQRTLAPVSEAIRLVRRHADALAPGFPTARLAGNAAYLVLRRRGRLRRRRAPFAAFLLGLIEVPVHQIGLRLLRRDRWHRFVTGAVLGAGR